MIPSRPSSRELFEFMIKCGIRLRCKNKATCTAIMMMHRLKDSQLFDKICNHTLATAAMMLACKHEEDLSLGPRDFVNVSYSLLHPDSSTLKIDQLLWDMRKGLVRLEFLLLRELQYDMGYEHPMQYLCVYLEQLRSWMPQDFERTRLEESAVAICRDIYIQPEFITDRSPESIAVTCIAIALEGHKLEVPECRDWYKILHPTITSSKLEDLMAEVLHRVYGYHIPDE